MEFSNNLEVINISKLFLKIFTNIANEQNNYNLIFNLNITQPIE